MLKYTVAKANLQCEGTNTSVLIDSCASASLVSAEFLKNLRVINKRHIKAKPIQQKLQINGVGGHHDQPTHYVWLRIKIGQKQIWHPFIIYDSFQHELLMGLDFIATYGGVIDTSENTCTWKKLDTSTPITTQRKEERVAQMVQLYSLEKVIIQPWMSRLISTSAPNISSLSHGNIRGNVNTAARIANKRGILTIKGPTTTLTNGKTDVFLANLTDKPVTIHKGTYVSTFTPFDIECDTVPVADLFGTLFNPVGDTTEPTTSTNNQQDIDLYLSTTINDNLSPTEDENIRANLKELGVDLSNSVLTPAQQNQMRQVLHHFRDVLTIEPDNLTTTDLVDFDLRIKDNSKHKTPINGPPYKRSPAQRRAVKEHTKKMLQAGVISTSESPWASPVVMVPKKRWRALILR